MTGADVWAEAVDLAGSLSGLCLGALSPFLIVLAIQAFRRVAS